MRIIKHMSRRLCDAPGTFYYVVEGVIAVRTVDEAAALAFTTSFDDYVTAADRIPAAAPEARAVRDVLTAYGLL